MTAVDSRKRKAKKSPDHYQRYRAWWGRPWAVYREDDLEPDIPRLPDINNYQDRSYT